MAGLSHDEDGRIAEQGKVNDGLVAAALATPFFSKPLPHSADRFDFDHVDVSGMSVEDGAATLCAVTVRAVVKGRENRCRSQPASVWVTGGGVHHPVIMRMLTESFGNVQNMRADGPQPGYARSRMLRVAGGAAHEGIAADDSANNWLPQADVWRGDYLLGERRYSRNFAAELSVVDARRLRTRMRFD